MNVNVCVWERVKEIEKEVDGKKEIEKEVDGKKEIEKMQRERESFDIKSNSS